MGVPVVTITPSSPLTTDTLSAEVSTDLGTPTLSWFKNGEEQSDLADTTVVLASATARDETWTAQASVQVGTEATPRVGSSFVTIGNTPPVISSVDLSPNAGTVETIFACEATASDADLSEWDDEVLCLDP